MRQEIRNGRFRADLYHRLSVFTISVPPLRDLGDDKLTLLDHFRDFYARQAGVQAVRLSTTQAMALWLDYGFPGNVRELRNIVIRLTTKHAGQEVNAEQLQAELDMESMDVELPGLAAAQDFKALLEAAKRQLQVQTNFNLDATLQQWERGYVEAALVDHPGQSDAGREAAGHPSHHALQPHAELRDTGAGEDAPETGNRRARSPNDGP